MNLSIGQVAKQLNLPVSAIRYYDNAGLIPGLRRNAAGKRQFNDANLLMLETVNCLRETGMPIRDIKHYADLVRQGPSTHEARHQLLVDQQAQVQQQIADLQKNLHYLGDKLTYYDQHPQV
ncbi:MerR family transcriptional regulator [Lacticaseibacillus jixiensis]|uniref:MerR family transcriptional regulator n=1 Tax=Lacticaseibacillus jixiensis TaxID=3231926 RepID=UPI0036F33022